MKQAELIGKCENENDRKLMFASMNRSNKLMGRAHFAIGLSIVSFIIMFFGFYFESIITIVPSFIIGFCSLAYVATVPLRGVGII